MADQSKTIHDLTAENATSKKRIEELETLEAEHRQAESSLKQFEWMLSRKAHPTDAGQAKDHDQGYADLTELNRDGLILKSIGRERLESLADDYLELLGTSSAIYEINGDYALAIFSSGWCRTMDRASRQLCNTLDNVEALNSGRWLCHESCWTGCSEKAISKCAPVDIECNGGIRLYAVPIIAGGNVVGAINFGYDNPPKDPEKLRKIADVYPIKYDDLVREADAYDLRPPFIIELAKKRLRATARLIGSMIETKQAEEQLRQSEEKYRNILASIQEGYFELDLEGTYTFVNDANCRLLGYTREELIGMNAREHFSDEENYNWAMQCYRDLYMTGTPVDSLKIMSVKKDGSEGIFETSVTLMKDSQGTPVGFRGVSRDITDRKRAEEAMLRAQKLESLGTLAGGIAHDFNNLMTSVQGYIELAQLDIPSDSVSHERLEAALHSTRQTRELTDRLITFSRGGNPWKKTIDLAEVIKDTVTRTVKGSGVRVAFDVPEDLRPVDADEHQLRQCFFNLALNAVEAMPDGGMLTVGAENWKVSSEEVPDLQEGSYLRITFSDDGVGIASEIQSKLFDPYFTTKGMGAQKGGGLGLSVCYSVFKRHGGTITVTSRPGDGAAFVIYLPAVADTAG